MVDSALLNIPGWRFDAEAGGSSGLAGNLSDVEDKSSLHCHDGEEDREHSLDDQRNVITPWSLNFVGSTVNVRLVSFVCAWKERRAAYKMTRLPMTPDPMAAICV